MTSAHKLLPVVTGSPPARGRRMVSGEWWVAVAAITSASSLRTQGPIRRVARVERCCSVAFAQNYSLWLWVPACAGTTTGEWRSRRQHLCRPCGGRDPYAVPLALKELFDGIGAKLLPVVMGPRVRGDDGC